MDNQTKLKNIRRNAIAIGLGIAPYNRSVESISQYLPTYILTAISNRRKHINNDIFRSILEEEYMLLVA